MPQCCATVGVLVGTVTAILSHVNSGFGRLEAAVCFNTPFNTHTIVSFDPWYAQHAHCLGCTWSRFVTTNTYKSKINTAELLTCTYPKRNYVC